MFVVNSWTLNLTGPKFGYLQNLIPFQQHLLFSGTTHVCQGPASVVRTIGMNIWGELLVHCHLVPLQTTRFFAVSCFCKDLPVFFRRGEPGEPRVYPSSPGCSVTLAFWSFPSWWTSSATSVTSRRILPPTRTVAVLPDELFGIHTTNSWSIHHEFLK